MDDSSKEPLMNEKREVSGFVPYRKRGDEWEFFLQMRDSRAKTNPNRLGVFGGGLEKGENIEQALFREIEEELKYIPRKSVYFSRFENTRNINNVFIEEIGDDFESLVHVCEGQYGKFLTADEADNLGKDKLTPMVRVIVLQLHEYLSK